MAIRGGPDIIEDGLVLHLDAAAKNSYPGSGNTWYDLSGDGNNATIYGLAHSSSNSGRFEGVEQGDRAIVVYDPQTYFTDQDWTWQVFWSGRIHPDVTVHNMPQLGYGTSSWPRLGIFRYANGNCKFWSYNNSGVSSRYDFDVSPQDTGWIHTVVTADYTNSVLKSYYNGDYYSQKTGFPVIANNTSNFGIGRSGNTSGAWNDSLQGNIAMVSIYNRTLSADEVKQNYKAIKSRFEL